MRICLQIGEGGDILWTIVGRKPEMDDSRAAVGTYIAAGHVSHPRINRRGDAYPANIASSP
jgi:hypothetical protein